MVKHIPLLLLAGVVMTAIVAAPKPLKEGLVSRDAAGKPFVVASLPGICGGPHISARLKVRYVIAGQPAEKYTVELWLGRTGSAEGPYHFDTQVVAILADKGGKLIEAKGRFDRRYGDRDDSRLRFPPGVEPRPGEKSLFWVERGKSWDCRLVV